MSKRRFPWILAAILLVSWAGWHAAGLVIAAVVLFVVYLSTLRLHPRVRHGRCNGSGEHHSWLFPWIFRKCGRCASGRIIRLGARAWGSGPIRDEARRTRQALAAARRGRAWR